MEVTVGFLNCYDYMGSLQIGRYRLFVEGQQHTIHQSPAVVCLYLLYSAGCALGDFSQSFHQPVCHCWYRMLIGYKLRDRDRWLIFAHPWHLFDTTPVASRWRVTGVGCFRCSTNMFIPASMYRWTPNGSTCRC